MMQDWRQGAWVRNKTLCPVLRAWADCAWKKLGDALDACIYGESWLRCDLMMLKAIDIKYVYISYRITYLIIVDKEYK